MKKYSVIYFIQQVYVEDKFPKDRGTRIVYSPMYVTQGGYTSHIEGATLFKSESEAIKSIQSTDETLYLIQTVYKNG
jgi:hypothetical protein